MMSSYQVFTNSSQGIEHANLHEGGSFVSFSLCFSESSILPIIGQFEYYY